MAFIMHESSGKGSKGNRTVPGELLSEVIRRKSVEGVDRKGDFLRRAGVSSGGIENEGIRRLNYGITGGTC